MTTLSHININILNHLLPPENKYKAWTLKDQYCLLTRPGLNDSAYGRVTRQSSEGLIFGSMCDDVSEVILALHQYYVSHWNFCCVPHYLMTQIVEPWYQKQYGSIITFSTYHPRSSCFVLIFQLGWAGVSRDEPLDIHPFCLRRSSDLGKPAPSPDSNTCLLFIFRQGIESSWALISSVMTQHLLQNRLCAFSESWCTWNTAQFSPSKELIAFWRHRAPPAAGFPLSL